MIAVFHRKPRTGRKKLKITFINNIINVVTAFNLDLALYVLSRSQWSLQLVRVFFLGIDDSFAHTKNYCLYLYISLKN